MKIQKILIILTTLLCTIRVAAQQNYGAKSACINHAYATPASVEPYVNTTLQFSTSDTVYTIAWSPSSSLTNPDSVETKAHPSVTTTYTVSGTTSCGPFTDTVTVFVECTVAI